jgi:hypothetical protein
MVKARILYHEIHAASPVSGLPLGLAKVQNFTKSQNCPKMTSVAKEKSEICLSFIFPITVTNENFNLAGALQIEPQIPSMGSAECQ